MWGSPNNLNSAADYKNAVDWCRARNSGKAEMIAKLEGLRDDVYILTLKESSKDKPADEQTADDYEQTLDPNPPKKRLGITDAQINTWIEELKA